MTVDDSKKVDAARQDRARDALRDQAKPRPKETDFDKVLERSRTSSGLLPQQTMQTKTVTEEAIKEAAKRQDRQSEDQKRDEGDRKDKRESKNRDERTEARFTGEKVVAKGHLKQFGGGSGGREGSGTFTSKKNLSNVLTKHGAKSFPVNLQSKFAARLSQSLKSSGSQPAVISQQVLNKIVQYVKIGINKKGENEIQLELHEKIFRGLRLRVVSKEGGKVGVHFRTSDEEGKTIFKKNSDAIRGALEKKGIVVDEIVIT